MCKNEPTLVHILANFLVAYGKKGHRFTASVAALVGATNILFLATFSPLWSSLSFQLVGSLFSSGSGVWTTFLRPPLLLHDPTIMGHITCVEVEGYDNIYLCQMYCLHPRCAF